MIKEVFPQKVLDLNALLDVSCFTTQQMFCKLYVLQYRNIMLGLYTYAIIYLHAIILKSV